MIVEDGGNPETDLPEGGDKDYCYSCWVDYTGGTSGGTGQRLLWSGPYVPKPGQSQPKPV